MAFPGQELLKYRTADSILSEVEDELSKYTNNNLVDRSSLLKVIQKCNAQLGLKINKDKEAVISVSDYKAELPVDFFKFNYGFLCTGDLVVREPDGWPTRQYEEVVKLDPHVRYDVDPCSVKTLCCKDYVVTERQKFRTTVIPGFAPIALRNTNKSIVDEDCPNWKYNCVEEFSIQGDEINTNFKTGNIYLTYTGMMEDKDGNLVLLDHPLINDFYEASLKHKAFDIMEDNGENVSQLRQKWELRKKEEKNNAEDIVDTPEFEEIGAIWAKHRRRIYNRYLRQVYG